MRDSFHDDLDGIGVSLVQMGHLVNKAMERATTALLTADLKVAEEIISEDEAIDNMQYDIESRAINFGSPATCRGRSSYLGYLFAYERRPRAYGRFGTSRS